MQDCLVLLAVACLAGAMIFTGNFPVIRSGREYRLRRMETSKHDGEAGRHALDFPRDAILLPLGDDLWECVASPGGVQKLNRGDVETMLKAGWVVVE